MMIKIQSHEHALEMVEALETYCTDAGYHVVFVHMLGQVWEEIKKELESYDVDTSDT